MSEATPKTVTGNFQLGAQMADGRTINMSCYLIEGEDAASLNARLDFCQDAIERQRIRCEIPILEGKREQMVNMLGQIKEVLGDLAVKKQNEGGLSSAEKQAYNTHSVNIVKYNEEIKKGDEAIREARRKVGMAA